MTIRKAVKSDIDSLTDMFSKMYILNSEFDPLLQVPDDIKQRVRDSVEDALNDEKSLIYIYEDGKPYAAIKIKLDEREFYAPSKVARIEEFYVHPAKRREGLGGYFLSFIEEELKKMGVTLIIARFPSKNLIAVSFYSKSGFREIHNEFAKSVD
ncbi:MAG: GNAT family N-acetyltransferase [Nitrososphaerota archaeon]|jgi:GNAT superfamily N-acetyltransferase|nr:GNAT family N-acetyltransferase [Nitrososphaerota archaeon]MDG6928276.1 GNAT family N-acetyltransferase [Nitrososphaerota archaeon]MDG6929738.1 GNAT family N-acetyltransferase [Nitrososphaerota archaeon]MDG6932826.1 GNAT family N-acetyltransferase [Nitrososphaerota archaeon]MDG6935375.1 GNAT family N-acetyltransferase [Nitrososphaerota archaeon]